MLSVAPDYMQKINMTHYKLAWIQAIIEANIPCFYDIKWADCDLIIQVDEIQKYLAGVLEETIREYFETEDAQKEMLWKKIGIIINDNNPVENKVHPEYLISRSVTIRLLIHVAPYRLVFSDEVLKKIVKKKKQEANKARHPHLQEAGLFGELILNVSRYCTENPVKLDVTKLPKRIWLKYLAGYLAIPSNTLLFKDIIYDSDLCNTTTRIHVELRKALNKKLDITIEPLSVMFFDQLKTAEDAGVIDIALVAVNKASSSFDNLSCEVTRELAVDLLKLLPEFNYLFTQNEESIDPKQQNVIQHKNVERLYEKITSAEPVNLYTAPTPRPSLTCQERTAAITAAVEHLLCDDLTHILDVYAIWVTLLTKQNDPDYKIIKIQGSGSKKEIVFANQQFDYKNATQHINKVIEWRRGFIFHH